MEQEKLYIVSNQAKCLSCGDSIYSMHRHDYVSCSCGKLAVDGGQDYIRRNYSGEYEEQSIELPEELVKALRANLRDSLVSGRNTIGATLAVLRGIRDNGYELTKVEK
ncbi:MAG: hypothetical protein KUG81_11110 [Gammaproteobacteria bacterium]|nr:hypothetical protein [Gammaproteobacteria bacterium]